MTRMSDNLRGALLMVLAMAAFAFGDSCVKMIDARIPLAQLLLLRGCIASSVLALLAWRLGGLDFRLPRRDWGLIALRSLADLATALCFMTALFNMPLANATAILQTTPLAVTLGGALVLGEEVGWRRWSAILVGFAGMLLIVRPGGDGFNSYALLALASVVFVTIRDLATRRMSARVPSLTVTLVGAAVVTLFGGLGTIGRAWVPPEPEVALLICGSAVFIIGGYLFSVMTMRVGEVGVISPFRYTGLLWALLLGWLVFGEWPLPLTLVGAGIVVATGVYTLIREARVARRARQLPANTRLM